MHRLRRFGLAPERFAGLCLGWSRPTQDVPIVTSGSFDTTFSFLCPEVNCSRFGAPVTGLGSIIPAWPRVNNAALSISQVAGAAWVQATNNRAVTVILSSGGRMMTVPGLSDRIVRLSLQIARPLDHLLGTFPTCRRGIP